MFLSKTKFNLFVMFFLSFFIKDKILFRSFVEKYLVIFLGSFNLFKWFSINLNSLIFNILFIKLNLAAVLIPSITASP